MHGSNIYKLLTYRAISELQQFLNMITVEANKCVEALSEMEEARDVIAAEDEE